MTDKPQEKEPRRYREGSVYRKAGSPYWYVRYWHGGRQYRESSKSEKRQVAVRLLNTRRGELADRRFVGLAVERTTLDGLLAATEREYRLRGRKSTARLKQHFAHLRAYFGGGARALDDITEERLERYAERRLDQGGAPATVRGELYALHHAYRVVRLRAPVVPVVHVANARSGFLTDADIAALLPHLPAYLQPVIEAAYITGWRVRSELLAMRWTQVDWGAGALRLERGMGKTGEPRSFPFTDHPRLAAIIGEQRERATALEGEGRMVPWVFFHPDGPRRGRQIRGWYYDSWRTACDKAGLGERIVHDLRRSCVRNLVTRAGVDERVAMTITGHLTRAVFDRYHIVAAADQRAAVRRLASLAPEGPAVPKVVPIAANIGPKPAQLTAADSEATAQPVARARRRG